MPQAKTKSADAKTENALKDLKDSKIEDEKWHNPLKKRYFSQKNFLFINARDILKTSYGTKNFRIRDIIFHPLNKYRIFFDNHISEN